MDLDWSDSDQSREDMSGRRTTGWKGAAGYPVQIVLYKSRSATLE
jgi:hypothetical protein